MVEDLRNILVYVCCVLMLLLAIVLLFGFLIVAVKYVITLI